MGKMMRNHGTYWMHVIMGWDRPLLLGDQMRISLSPLWGQREIGVCFPVIGPKSTTLASLFSGNEAGTILK
jgi:hypothetical protein